MYTYYYFCMDSLLKFIFKPLIFKKIFGCYWVCWWKWYLVPRIGLNVAHTALSYRWVLLLGNYKLIKTQVLTW